MYTILIVNPSITKIIYAKGICSLNINFFLSKVEYTFLVIFSFYFVESRIVSGFFYYFEYMLSSARRVEVYIIFGSFFSAVWIMILILMVYKPHYMNVCMYGCIYIVHKWLNVWVCKHLFSYTYSCTYRSYYFY